MKELKEISRIVSSVCSHQPAVAAAYVFGSAAKGRTGKHSDIDVAVLLDETYSKSFSLLSLMTDLEESLKCRTDVIVLNHAGELLKYHVRRDGKLVFERSSRFRKDFEIRGRKSYEDFLYLHKKYAKTVVYGEKHG